MVNTPSDVKHWDVSFLEHNIKDDINGSQVPNRRALIIVNQPFSSTLLQRVWDACSWRACADGGANRLYDALEHPVPAGNVKEDEETEGNTRTIGRERGRNE